MCLFLIRNEHTHLLREDSQNPNCVHKIIDLVNFGAHMNITFIVKVLNRYQHHDQIDNPSCRVAVTSKKRKPH